MDDKKDAHKEFSTCFEKLPFAEMMRKMMSRQGVGSLCAEMMEKIMERQDDGCSFDCAEMMRKMMSRQGVGSLCAEMMEKIMERQDDGCSFDCAEMMRKMMKERSKVQEDSQKSKEEVCHGRKESWSEVDE